ncbi:MAG: hypothetical protein EBR83_07360 [Verrucomicrobia bacterium]|nr:hypothetical protein [Verrucomicrobiota bacterium]
MRSALACLFLGLVASYAADAPVKFSDPKPQAYHLTVRASEVDPAAKSYPDIDFNLENKGRLPTPKPPTSIRASRPADSLWSG